MSCCQVCSSCEKKIRADVEETLAQHVRADAELLEAWRNYEDSGWSTKVREDVVDDVLERWAAAKGGGK